MVNGRHDAWSKTLVSCRSETVQHNKQSVDLRKVKSNFLGLGCDVFDAFTAVNPNYFILICVFQYFK